MASRRLSTGADGFSQSSTSHFIVASSFGLTQCIFCSHLPAVPQTASFRNRVGDAPIYKCISQTGYRPRACDHAHGNLPRYAATPLHGYAATELHDTPLAEQWEDCSRAPSSHAPYY